MTATGTPLIDGTVAPGYEQVRKAFVANFMVHSDVGAAFAAYVDGELVVDLWGGLADKDQERPWTRDTLQLVFSSTKGLVATAIMVLVDRNQLDLDQPVARYWPEFAAHGKGAITVAEALSHRAGVPGLAATVDAGDLLDDVGMAARVADQPALWDGSERLTYHAFTYGWIAGEVVRRVTGMSVGEFFAREIATPLKLQAWIGLPAEFEDRVSKLVVHDSFRAAWKQVMQIDGLKPVYGNPPMFSEPLIWNRQDVHAAQIPGANGIATARAMAALYGCLACGGRLSDVKLVEEASIDAVTAERARGLDALSSDHLAFASGFGLQTPDVMFGPAGKAFGHGGAGGSANGAWRQHRTGFSYVMNEMREELTDERARVLLASLYAAVASRLRR